MIVKTDYRDHGARKLVNYIGRDGNRLYDRTGREIDADERERFVEQSEHHHFMAEGNRLEPRDRR